MCVFLLYNLLSVDSLDKLECFLPNFQTLNVHSLDLKTLVGLWFEIVLEQQTTLDSKVNRYEKRKQITHILKVYQLEYVFRYYDPIY